MNLFLTYYLKKRLIIKLSIQELTSKFSGSFLGVTWAFVGPIVTITILYFVFHFGFKSQPIQDVPFLIWLISGMFPWTFFSESLMTATSSILEKPYLVKKVLFDIEILPLVKIVSNFYIHLIFIIFIIIFSTFYKVELTIHFLQIFYYTFCCSFFILSLSLGASSIIVFARDIGQIIGILLQFGFWVTPIFWHYKVMSPKTITFLKLNPMMYITEGYRESVFLKIWFWEKPYDTLYFWIISLTLFFLGQYAFKKLRPSFSDIL